MSKNEESVEQLQHMRLMISSEKFLELEEACADFVRIATGMCLRVSGAARLPGKVVNTFSKGGKPVSNYQVRVYSKFIDIHCSPEVVDQIVSGFDLPDVHIEVKVIFTGWRPLSTPRGWAIFSDHGEKSVEQLQHLRVMISSVLVLKLEKVCVHFIRIAEGMRLRVWGPARLPVAKTKTRLFPSPEGTNLIPNKELRVYSRFIDILSSEEVVDQIVSGFHVFDVMIEVKEVGSTEPRPVSRPRDWAIFPSLGVGVNSVRSD